MHIMGVIVSAIEITWHNCAEQMPPDDDSLIIVKISYIKPGVDYVYVGLISNYLAVTSKAFLDMLGRYAEAESKHWTLYNQEKWEALNAK